MECSLAWATINWLGVFFAALSAFAVGALWYSPFLFGNLWLKENAFDEETQKKANMTKIFSLAFVLSFISAIFLDVFIANSACVFQDIVHAILIWFGFVATSFGLNYLFAKKSFKLYLIDVGYYLVIFVIMAIILRLV